MCPLGRRMLICRAEGTLSSTPPNISKGMRRWLKYVSGTNCCCIDVQNMTAGMVESVKKTTAQCRSIKMEHIIQILWISLMYETVNKLFKFLHLPLYVNLVSIIKECNFWIQCLWLCLSLHHSTTYMLLRDAY